MNKQTLFLAMTALVSLAACGKPTADVHAVGMCQQTDIHQCSTYTVQTQLNIAQQATVSAVVRANCATMLGTFTGDASCSTADTVGYCVFGSFKASDVDVRETVGASKDQADTEKQLCSQRGGSWTDGTPTF